MFFSSLRFCFCFLLPLPLVSLFLPPPSHFPSSPFHFSFPSSPSLLIPHLTFPFLRLPLTSFHLPLLLSFPPTHLSFPPPSRFPSPTFFLFSFMSSHSPLFHPVFFPLLYYFSPSLLFLSLSLTFPPSPIVFSPPSLFSPLSYYLCFYCTNFFLTLM